ncbi:aminodeoxychorismate lyase [Lysobacter silvisoli]|uniref:Aminodeoxychorismate lyase n=1 Tax=Lysobacter silvisoli TaxID=2293254 RepID=A0A371K1Y2_9GAMM|nr:aminodeoxychorismate lyase [Lysobacter silvisoli]RDZ27943.1 aminodeoxychorismate lyase [Lysobacter silvisoli]
MRLRVYVGEREADGVPPNDRGMAYGDGLFETLRAHRGELPWWDAHWARLQRGAARLRLPLPAQAQAHAQARELLAGEDAVLKLLVSRGAGGRGYAPPAQAVPTWQLSVHALPPASAAGLNLRWCQTRLAAPSALAGLKHCNRLEQVLARGEWNEAGIDEGLMRDGDGWVVSATAANVFVLRDDRWLTPDISRCGVAGVCRGWLLQTLGEQAGETSTLSQHQLETADAVFLCNAVRGILPVARLGERVWRPHPAVAGLQRRLAAAHPAFAAAAPAGPEVS